MDAAGTLSTPAELVELLAQGELFTDLARKITGCDITCEITCRRVEGLDCEARRELHAWRDRATWGQRRHGVMLAAGVPVAFFSSLYLPQRAELAPVRRVLLETDEPIGPVLREIGGWREHQGAREVRDRGAVARSHGRLVLPGTGTSVPAALVWEEALPQLFAART